MIARLFQLAGIRIELFPPEQAGMPPRVFWGFMFHYTQPFWPMIIVSAALSAPSR